MTNLLWLVPALPMIGALLLILFGRRISQRLVSVVGAGSVGASALVTMGVGASFLSSGEKNFTQVLWQWVEVGSFSPSF
jgi:NADH-quinone oxidoreductase subunit L